MNLTPEQLASIFAQLRTLQVVKKYFRLTDEQLEHPNCGDYLEQILKNMETPAKVLRQLNLQKDFPGNPPFPGEMDKGTPNDPEKTIDTAL